MSAPVDHELLADYVGGALEGTPEAERVGALIATSPAWRAAADELTAALGAVSEDLQHLSGYSESMPADIAARFDDLFASPAMAPKPSPARDPLAERRVQRSSSAARRTSWRKWTVPVAAMAVAAAGFFVFQTGLLPQQDSGGNMTAEKAVDTSAPGAAEDSAGTPPTVSSGRDYSRQTVTQQPVAPAVEPQRSGGEKLNVPRTFGSAASASPVNLKACLAEVAKVIPGVVTLVDYASFEGQPALVISITSGAQRWVFVAGPSCGINGAHELFRTPLK
ncbi:hypothetical protein [Catelliglobosispora koreensis]|uniref:hypothetical protein n=1 Tax=Catelliglobosispora koreensis TaxID=129052 RepID=UPI0003811CF0|nr:hypothetical protein [Catelliglobosispora koreensis]